MEKTVTITLNLTEDMKEALLDADQIFEEAAEMGSINALSHFTEMIDIVRQVKSQLVSE
jgi:shikimate 5-dehydrogenase